MRGQVYTVDNFLFLNDPGRTFATGHFPNETQELITNIC